MVIGSDSGWLMLAGMMARPRATSSRTNSGVTKAGMRAPKLSPSARRASASSAWRCAAEILAVRDVDHLLGDDAGPRKLELRHRISPPRCDPACAQRRQPALARRCVASASV